VAWITAQGDDPAVLDDPNLLPQAPLVETVPAPRDGFLTAIDAAEDLTISYASPNTWS
jgi:thymidine phosphorylase